MPRPALHLVEASAVAATAAKSKFHLSPTAAFYLQASITVMFLAGSRRRARFTRSINQPGASRPSRSP